MTLGAYLDVKQSVIAAGYADEIDWAERVGPPKDADTFAAEIIYVICNSGMKAQVARGIYDRVMERLRAGARAGEAFGHRGKCSSIDRIWTDRARLFKDYLAAVNKLDFLAGIAWIGGITKWHAAKNLGLDAVKPDRHLVRIAVYYKKTPDALCRDLAQLTGDRIGTVDVVLWRAANLGILDTRGMVG